LAAFWDVQEHQHLGTVADMLCGIRQVHAEFGKRSELDPEEKRLVAALNLQFKGATGWPRFRSFRPGWFPWRIDEQEARWLTLALEQLLDVAPRLQTDRRLLGTEGGAKRRYLVRAPSPDDARVWQDQRQAFPPPQTAVQIAIPNEVLAGVRALPGSRATFEVDVVPSFMGVREKKSQRPQMPYLMLAVDADSGFVYGMELLTVGNAFEDMCAEVPAKLLDLVRHSQQRPACLAVRTPWLLSVMAGVCREVGIQLQPSLTLPALNEARQALREFSRG
jgi:hypothetical protein